ncbi:metallopeptidase family protein [Patescibacteria group bacterium]|nr:metallopeptidase family protein [Patescibacteria group bacterium]MBU1448461.1 metallopeptidase family protein [Patescibacteria group bacterium]MBU2613004.1 metallopeptidase family protein [Patescibacteria group bacterium]
MDRPAFIRHVEAAIAGLDASFPGVLRNVAVCVEDEPDEATCLEQGLGPDETLLGLYDGVPTTERSYEEGWMMPDKVTLYIDPILDEADDDGRSIEDVIRDVVWHEVAHHLGLDEDRADAVERRRRSGSTT